MVRKITNESKSTNRRLNEANEDLTKINVTSARKLYNAGETVYLLPNKIKPGNMWIQPCAIDKSSGETFDSHINAFSYYNCNTEVGTGVAYYK